MRALDGRLFDDNAVRAQCVSAEAYDAAIAGGW
jgi:hypothetical protein